MDSIALRGFAQVLPRQSSSNTMINQIMKMQQQGAELATKKRASDEEWYNKLELTNGDNLIPELQSKLQGLFSQTKNAMDQVHYTAMKMGGHSEQTRASISAIKAQYDKTANLFNAGTNAVKQIIEISKNDKNGLIDRGALGSELNALVSQAYKVEADGSVTVDPVSVGKIENMMNNHKIYSPTALKNAFIDTDLAQADHMFQKANSDGSVTSGVVRSSSGLYKTDATGTPIMGRDGRPVVGVAPETVRLWDQNPTRKKWLDDWTNELAMSDKNFKPGVTNVDDYRSAAFEKNIAETSGKFEIKSVSTRQPDSGSIRDAKRDKIAETRYDQIRSIVWNPEKGKDYLGTLFGDGYKVQYENGGIQVYTRGKNKDMMIIAGTEDAATRISKERMEWTKYYEEPLKLNDPTTEDKLWELKNTIGSADERFPTEVRHLIEAKKGNTPKKIFGFAKKEGF